MEFLTIMKDLQSKIVPVILSGGSGTRLWPLSRQEKPKQLLALTEEQTMLQLTALRAADADLFGSPIIVANAAHAAMIAEQLAAVRCLDPIILLEPFGRNTAPAIALAALAADPSSILLIMPSDHVIADLQAFHDAISRAVAFVNDGWLVTFGIQPDGPETGYGYIRLGKEQSAGVHVVDRFIEKPDAADAEAMLAEGGYTWNAGIFAFRADAYLEALETFQPDMLRVVKTCMAQAVRMDNVIRPDPDSFDKCPSDSIDYAVMEKAKKVACVPVSMGWSDVGSWDSLHAISDKDEGDNVLRGDILALGTTGCLVHSDGPRVALVDVDDLIVVATKGDIMILRRGDSQKVRRITDALKGK
jgi:mannose-1-phosphate guanylyltransferase